MSSEAVVLILVCAATALASIAVAAAYHVRHRHLLRQAASLQRAIDAVAADQAPQLAFLDEDGEPRGERPVGRSTDELDPELLETPVALVGGPLEGVERGVRRLRATIVAERQTVSRLERAVRAIPEGLVLADEQGDIVYRNDVAAEFAGGRHGDALVDAAVRQLMGDAVHEGRVGHRTLDLFGPPRRTMVVSTRPVVTDGRVVGALAVISDLTEKRRLEAIRRDFVANISHELKTPVGALSLLVETLMDETDPQIVSRLGERLLSEATRLANTIDDLLTLSRIESGDSPEYQAVPVSAVLTEAVDRLRPAAEQRGITLKVEEVDRSLSVWGDRRQLVSALYNLLDNAAKYSEAGSDVAVTVETEGSILRMTVTDQGMGIPVKDLERIFERFYRVDVARSRQTGGTGLGLSIVRHVMANHHGQVTVESRLGEGSTFTLQLPLIDTESRLFAANGRSEGDSLTEMGE